MVCSIINTMNHFSSAKNIDLIWSILIDELMLERVGNDNTLLRKVKTIFDANVPIFVEKVREIKPLVELNKMFLRQVIIAVHRLIPNFNEERRAKKISISAEEPIGSPYKVEDIRRASQDSMALQFNQRRAEFDALMTSPKPTNIDFLNLDTNDDSRLAAADMDAMIAEKTAERNTLSVMEPVVAPKRVSFEEPAAQVVSLTKKEKYAEQISASLPELTTTPVEPTQSRQKISSSIVPSNEIKEQLSIVNGKIALLDAKMQQMIDLLEKQNLPLTADMETQTDADE